MRTGKPEINWRQIGLGTGVSMVTVLTMTGLGAWLLERELVGMEWMNYLAALILLVSAFVGGKTAGASPDRWAGPALAGVGLWLILVLLHAVGFGGAPEGMVPAALAILGGTGASVLLSRGGKRPGHRVRKYRNR